MDLTLASEKLRPDSALLRAAGGSPERFCTLEHLGLNHNQVRVYVKQEVQAEGLEGVIEAITGA